MYRLTYYLLFVCFSAASQGVLNGSFEGESKDATMPSNWHMATPGTTPEICPGPFGVENEPQHGDTYLGLITRTDGSFESIGQRFMEKLVKGGCYIFDIHLAHSDQYAGYDDYVNCRIWLGTSKGKRDFILKDFGLIKHDDWKRYHFTFRPKSNYKYLIIEAQHPSEGAKSKGNILLDNLRVLSCDRT